MPSKQDGLFPPNRKQHLFPANKKLNLFGDVNKPFNIFDKDTEEIIRQKEQMEQAEKEGRKAAAVEEKRIAGLPKKPLFRLYDKHDTLLFVTKTPQLQSQMGNKWFWDVAYIRVEFFNTFDEQDNARVMAIHNENPKWNTHYNVQP